MEQRKCINCGGVEFDRPATATCDCCKTCGHPVDLDVDWLIDRYKEERAERQQEQLRDAESRRCYPG